MPKFICNYIPALSVGLGGKMYQFQYGILELEEGPDADDLRRHQWFGTHIFEQGPEPLQDAAPEEPEREDASSAIAFLDQTGAWRCRECGDASPIFVSERAVQRHWDKQHKPAANLIKTR